MLTGLAVLVPPTSAAGQDANMTSVISRTEDDVRWYQTDGAVTFYSCVNVDQVAPGDPTTVVGEPPIGSSFTIVDANDEWVRVRFGAWDVDSENYRLFNAPQHSWCAPTGILAERAYALDADESGFAFVGGAYTVPLKFRPGWGDSRLFDYGAEPSVLVAFGAEYRFSSRFSLALSLAAGATSIRISGDDGVENIGGMSLGLGLQFTADKVSAGLVLGWDFVGPSHRSIWAYHGATWIGLSLGVSLFHVGDSSAPGAENTGASTGGSSETVAAAAAR